MKRRLNQGGLGDSVYLHKSHKHSYQESLPFHGRSNMRRDIIHSATRRRAATDHDYFAALLLSCACFHSANSLRLSYIPPHKKKKNPLLETESQITPDLPAGLKLTLTFQNPGLSCNPRYGFFAPPSRSISPAHALQVTGLSLSAPRTRPMDTRTTDVRVSILMSSGMDVGDDDVGAAALLLSAESSWTEYPL